MVRLGMRMAMRWERVGWIGMGMRMEYGGLWKSALASAVVDTAQNTKIATHANVRGLIPNAAHAIPAISAKPDTAWRTRGVIASCFWLLSPETPPRTQGLPIRDGARRRVADHAMA